MQQPKLFHRKGTFTLSSSCSTQVWNSTVHIKSRYFHQVLVAFITLYTKSFELHLCSLSSSEVFTDDSALCYTIGYSSFTYKKLSNSGHNQFPVLSTCTGLFSLISVYNFHFIGAIRPFSAHKGNYCAFGWLSKSLGL